MASLRKHRSPQWQPGFTLAELLVSISIISLLVAVMLPSLARARTVARSLVCQTNLRAIAQAGLTYAADDARELSIPIGTADGDPYLTQSYYAFLSYGGKSGIGRLRNPNRSTWAGGNLMGAPHRPLNQHLYKHGIHPPPADRFGFADWRSDAERDLPIYRCPADRGFPGMHWRQWKDSGLSAYDHFGSSYNANAFFLSEGPGQPLYSASIYLRPLSDVPTPQNTILYMEFAGWFARFATNSDLNQACWFWPTLIGEFTAYGHHGKAWQFNAAFGDGHASSIRMHGHGVTPDGVQPNGESPAWTTRWCSSAPRGPGWQMDTLPAQLIRTHKFTDDSHDTYCAIDEGCTAPFKVEP